MRLIDADAFIETNKDIIDCSIDHSKYEDTLKELIDNAPTVERPTGEWIYNRPNSQTGANVFRCSICNYETQAFTCGIKNPKFDNYCGNCGADMRMLGTQSKGENKK